MNQNYQEKQVIDMLNEQLQEQLLVESNNIVINQSPIFKNNFSETVILNTIKLIKEMRLTPKDIIYNQGDIDDQYIYFIEKGKVEQYFQVRQGDKNSSANLIKIGEYTKGNSFGELEFFTNQPKQTTIKCKDFITLLVIKRSDFLEMIKQYPEDYEKFCMLKDRLLNNKEYQLIGHQCISCYKISHFAQDCPLINYKPQTLTLLNRGNNLRQERVKQKRRLRNKMGLGNIDDIQENAEYFIENNLSFLEGFSELNIDSDQNLDENSQSAANTPSDNRVIKVFSPDRQSNEFPFNFPQKNKPRKTHLDEDIKMFASNNRLSVIADNKARISIQLKPSQEILLESPQKARSRQEFPHLSEFEKIPSLNILQTDTNGQNSYGQLKKDSQTNLQTILVPNQNLSQNKQNFQNSMDLLRKCILHVNDNNISQFKTLDKKMQNLHELICQQNQLQQNINHQNEDNHHLEFDLMKNFQHYFIYGNCEDIIRILQYKNKRMMKLKLQNLDQIRRSAVKNSTIVKTKSSKFINESQSKNYNRRPTRFKEYFPQMSINSKIVSFGQQ